MPPNRPPDQADQRGDGPDERDVLALHQLLGAGQRAQAALVAVVVAARHRVIGRLLKARASRSCGTRWWSDVGQGTRPITGRHAAALVARRGGRLSAALHALVRVPVSDRARGRVSC
jgi:hypothetical protein